MLTKALIIVAVVAGGIATTGRAADSEQSTFRYRAYYFPVDPAGTTTEAQLSFVGERIFNSETDVVETFEGCALEGPTIRFKSSMARLNFEVNVGTPASDIADDKVLRFVRESTFMGEKIKVIGLTPKSGALTVLYVSDQRGLLGFALLGDLSEWSEEFYAPTYWLEGARGLCR